MKKRNVIALSLLAGILLALGFLTTPLMRHARSAAWDNWVTVAARVFGIRGISISDNALDTLTKITMENIRLKAELSDYQRLKTQLGSPPFDSMQALPAQVLARPIDTLTSSYIINKGIADGISNGAPVLVQGSVLLGFIQSLSEHSATVQTLFHPSTSITVETTANNEEKPARGILKSRYQTSLGMETIPRDALVHVGQHIVTTSKANYLPYGMLIGSVASLSNPENEAYQSATLEVPYDSNAIDAVTVLVTP